ncbi:cystathionine beta-synthase [Nocardioides anomalus]|uniref:Cystathionine beta-synthase n=1 Tax=Nocardioides anomalus TaxID=2712223 RepID=A0A6G6WGN1_9ACTN|nr:cystathionine beta-synthase [Nocardioides anomalus]QIG44369.1 cystathionine beta-synthase [Nocardioides anomalus]
MDYANTLLDLIGDTPLVRLHQTLDLPDEDGPLVLAKVEYLNPGGSVKDRIASRMIDAAEASGALQPGGTIVEPTSGNTGVGLAMVAQQRGYHCVFVCPDKVSVDKRNVLKAYGAEVVVCPTAVAPEHPDSYYNVSDRLSKQPGAWKPDQYSNPNNPRSHYETTGPEIWKQTEGRITHFVTGMGTGGTISGVGRYLKEQNPQIQVVGADPAGSVYSGGTGRPYLVEGVGEDFWPETYDRSVADRVIEVSDADSFAFTRRLAREEAMLVGGSSGMAAYAARQLAQELRAAGQTDAIIVVLLPDSGRGYLTKIFNDDWLAQYGFPTGSETDTAQTIGEVLRGKTGRLPDLVHTHPGETIAEAIAILQEYDVSQMPVVRAEPPIVAAEVAGSVSDKVLMDALFGGNARLTDQVEDHMSPPMPTIGSTEDARDAVALLEGADAVLVHEDGKPVGVLTRQDLLAFLSR